MNQVVKAATPDEIARVEARNKFKDALASMAEAVAFVDENAGSRSLVIPLRFPVKHSGVVYSEVTIRRPVMREWRAYLRECQDAVKHGGPGADDLVDQPWLSIPAVIFENLDVMDATAVEAAQEGFFARSSPQAGKEEDELNSSSTTGTQSPSE